MRAQLKNWPFDRSVHAAVILAALVVLTIPRGGSRAADTEPNPVPHSAIAIADPFGPVETDVDPFDVVTSDAPVDAAAYVPQRTQPETKQADFQISVPDQIPAPDAAPPTLNAPAQPAANAKPKKDPCVAAVFKPLSELGIGIAQPAGQLPTDHATVCQEQITQVPGSLGVCRCWPTLCYQWDATCLCYQPLYFEEVNAERYGYVCDDCCCCSCCLQPAFSAAHFFGTIPCLPYCIAAEPYCQCAYTLGHYRPGSCGVPWRCHWPPWDPWAALTAGGVYTGLVFAIP